ncbi:hypothetical protein [Dactylosporangium sp. NPDC005555]|uniref:hypothetical protein n=1 Tax=Dactylosporangium sp. NPDC005555 TaxID=3154889 RepID=UPI0033A17A71
MSDDIPVTDGRDPADVIEHAVAHAIALARTWPAWDGRPIPAGDRVYTPHKAVRRIGDHLVDHLAELEARLAGATPPPDHWHASAVTTPGDLAAFTAEDADEAAARLARLAGIWALRLRALNDERLDRAEGDAWTLRQVAFRLGSTYYADAVGDLTPTQGGDGLRPGDDRGAAHGR